MRIFKNKIELKWIAVIFIIAGIGVALATTPMVGTSIFGCNGCYLYGDVTNTTGEIDLTQIPSGVAKTASQNTFTTKQTITNPNSGSDLSALTINQNDPDQWALIIETVKDGSLHGGLYLDGRAAVLNITTATGSPQTICSNDNELTRNNAQTCTVSNASLKDIVGEIGEDDINKFLEIPNYKYYWKEDKNRTTLHYGSTAQDVQKSFPNLARYDDKGNIQTYEILELITLAKATIKEQQKEINNLTWQNEIQAAQIRNICTNQPSLCS